MAGTGPGSDFAWSGGVVERFPRLRFVLSEFEIGWVAHFLQRLDHATYRTPAEAADYLTLEPSEYFRRNFSVTFEDDEAGVRTRDLIGLECLLWGNDYPHHDAIWPHSMKMPVPDSAGFHQVPLSGV